MAGRGVNRRQFGKILGAAGVGSALDPAAAPAQDAEARERVDALQYFTRDEAAFVDAAVDHLIPADELGPGALEAGVRTFIDRQLAGTFGTAAKWYMQGPWGEATPEQGYQRPLTPQKLYRLCIAAINEHCQSEYGEPFDGASSEQQLAVLRAMDDGSLSIPGVPIRDFFRMLHQNTIEGFFADPVHGGNRDKVGWRLVGFPGVAASYYRHFGKFNEPYEVEPVGIEDVVNRRAELDDHGHVIHERLPKRKG